MVQAGTEASSLKQVPLAGRRHRGSVGPINNLEGAGIRQLGRRRPCFPRLPGLFRPSLCGGTLGIRRDWPGRWGTPRTRAALGNVGESLLHDSSHFAYQLHLALGISHLGGSWGSLSLS